MAATLQRIASDGPDYFYKGEIAQKIARCSEKLGGLFTVEDFAAHRSDWVEPISANYRGYDVWEMPPTTRSLAASYAAVASVRTVRSGPRDSANMS